MDKNENKSNNKSVHEQPSVHQTLVMILQNVWWFVQNHPTCLIIWEICSKSSHLSYHLRNLLWILKLKCLMFSFQNVWWLIFCWFTQTFCEHLKKSCCFLLKLNSPSEIAPLNSPSWIWLPVFIVLSTDGCKLKNHNPPPVSTKIKQVHKYHIIVSW